jgi:hypothetical protein
MMDSNDDQTEELQRMRRAHKKRLLVLEEQIALKGSDAPAALLVDAEAARQAIKLIEAKLSLPPIDPEVSRILAPGDQFLALEQRLRYTDQKVEANISLLRQEVKMIDQRNATAVGQLRSDTSNWQADQDKKRGDGQRANRRLLIGVLVGQAFLLLVIVGILGFLIALLVRLG